MGVLKLVSTVFSAFGIFLKFIVEYGIHGRVLSIFTSIIPLKIKIHIKVGIWTFKPCLIFLSSRKAENWNVIEIKNLLFIYPSFLPLLSNFPCPPSSPFFLPSSSLSVFLLSSPPSCLFLLFLLQCLFSSLFSSPPPPPFDWQKLKAWKVWQYCCGSLSSPKMATNLRT